jgi:hypothetical protein
MDYFLYLIFDNGVVYIKEGFNVDQTINFLISPQKPHRRLSVLTMLNLQKS